LACKTFIFYVVGNTVYVITFSTVSKNQKLIGRNKNIIIITIVYLAKQYFNISSILNIY